ncbi:DUF6292 family protein [Streptomyces sp. NPDC059396]|uniref:DUF6292 family protein n=1 Tax=Streptomyces sp. NPDC059396 TaxID=3346819 RepID=UPI0036AE45F4
MTAHPHAPYATAVMTALGRHHDPADSWTAYDSDDGEVMIMEIVITLDRNRTRTAGWERDVFLFWSQIRGWEWAYETPDGRNSEPERLLNGPLVVDPADVARAVRILLAGGAEQLPAGGTERPHTRPVTLTPELEKALGDGSDDNPGDIDRTDAIALAAYADPIRTVTDALQAAGLTGVEADTGLHCAVTIRMTPDGGRAFSLRLGLGSDALLPMALHDIDIRPIGGSTTPARITLYLDGKGAIRLATLLHQGTRH